MPKATPKHLDLWICLALLLATLAVYSQVRHFEFVNFDDPEYVTANQHVRAGLTAGGIGWALTSFDAGNWFPITWLTHMADVQLFGLDSGWHHVTNVVLHCVAVLLLFAALRRMTGARWPSAFVAFLFALHPLHVESIAWVAERKDVLSAVFWCLTLWCYARYVERPRAPRFALVCLTFALGLMSKPMVVTLPVVLLLLDYWPLRRDLRVGLIWEKLPLLALSAADSLLTFLAQHQAGAVATVGGISLASRLANAIVASVTYVADMFWPAGLAVYYPFKLDLSPLLVFGCLLVLAAISYFALRSWKSRPYLAVGWCWYLITLAPVIGIVQVGAQSHADRYTYLPMIGLSIMLVWSAADLIHARPAARMPATATAVAACIACAVATWSQIGFWANGETLFRHTLAVTSGNYVTHNNLANYYLEHGRYEEARQQAAYAVAIRPLYVEALVNLGAAENHLGNPSAAETPYRKATELKPSSLEAHTGLGASLAAQRRPAEALSELQTAVRLAPGSADSHYNLGKVLTSLGRNDDAAAEFGLAVRGRPDSPDAHLGFGIALAAQGKLNEAIGEFAAGVQLRPNDANAHYNLALALARAGRLDEAIAQFSEALRLRPDFEAARQNLAIATAQRNTLTKQ